MGKSYSDKSDGLNYIKDEELKREIYLKEIEEKNNKLFYENAKNYLNDEEIAIRRGLAVEEVKKLRE